MAINNHSPAVHYDGHALPRFDAIIPRIGTRMTFYGMAIVRQFEMMGVYCLNSASAIGASRDKLLAHQLLAQHRLGMPNTAFAKSSQDTKGIIDLAGGSPVVVKLLSSTQGKGVVLAETKKAAEALVECLSRDRCPFPSTRIYQRSERDGYTMFCDRRQSSRVYSAHRAARGISL